MFLNRQKLIGQSICTVSDKDKATAYPPTISMTTHETIYSKKENVLYSESMQIKMQAYNLSVFAVAESRKRYMRFPAEKNSEVIK